MRAADGEFRRDTRLGPFGEFIAGTERQAEIVGAGRAMSAEIHQVLAFKHDGSIVARFRVMVPVQFNKRVNLESVEQVIIQVVAVEEIISPPIVKSSRIRKSCQEI